MSRPELLSIAGRQDMARCHAAFKELVLDLRPIIDPRGITINIGPGDCEHVCIREERFDKRARREAGLPEVRDEFVVERAERISWIYRALTDPVEIVKSNKPGKDRSDVYLLCFPDNDPNNPIERFMVAVAPDGPKFRRFASAYPISLKEWRDARRGGQGHTLYRRRPRRY